MSIENRPYTAGWQQNAGTVVRHTPDVRVYFNGMLTIPGCPACNGSVDVQKYVTSVSVDASVNPVATATVSMSIPRHSAELFAQDGAFVLGPGIEVTIYMRGYFPMRGFAGTDSETREQLDVSGVDSSKALAYPYYQVFRGIVTEASHDYNGGIYSASLTCSDFLHFWSNLQVATNGAVMQNSDVARGASNVFGYMTGHAFTKCNPYAIIYTLFRVGYGSTGGADFQLAPESNHAANSWTSDTQMQQLAAYNMERILASHNMSLKMHGVNGKLYNAYEMAYIGAFYDRNRSTSSLYSLPDGIDYSLVTDKMQKFMREMGYNDISSIAQVLDGNSSKDAIVLNVMKQEAFMMDIGSLGALQLWETEYMTKLEIATNVCDITGFEFFQDVDGDLVFKPPFWNLDTSEDPTYMIKNRDLISFSSSSKEPEATFCKVTGTHFNAQGTGTDGWVAPGATYIDFRLVGMFGWREHSFEAGYLSSPKQMYMAAISRLDAINIGIHTCSITIPIRPELRPGYPVYIEDAQCFFYIESFSHQFQFGGQCTTAINGTARRRKWFPPGTPPSDRPVAVSDIRLARPDLPPTPIMTSTTGTLDPAQNLGHQIKPIGFPNVVMALDPNAADMSIVQPPFMSTADDAVDQVIRYCVAHGFLEMNPESAGTTDYRELRRDGPWKLRTGMDTYQEITKLEIENSLPMYREAQVYLTEGGYGFRDREEAHVALANSLSGAFGTLVGLANSSDLARDQQLQNWIALQECQKARWTPSLTTAANYRYYSSSHPEPSMQGPDLLRWDIYTGTTEVSHPTQPDTDGEVNALQDSGGSYPSVIKKNATQVERGLTVAAFDGEAASSSLTILTSQLHFVNWCYHTYLPNPTAQTPANGNQYMAGFNADAGVASQLFCQVLLAQAAKISEGGSMDPMTWFFGEAGDLRAGFESGAVEDGAFSALLFYVKETIKRWKIPTTPYGGASPWDTLPEGSAVGTLTLEQMVEQMLDPDKGVTGTCQTENPWSAFVPGRQCQELQEVTEAYEPSSDETADYESGGWAGHGVLVTDDVWTITRREYVEVECPDPRGPNYDSSLGEYTCGCVTVPGVSWNGVAVTTGYYSYDACSRQRGNRRDANDWGLPDKSTWEEDHIHTAGVSSTGFSTNAAILWYASRLGKHVADFWAQAGERYFDLLVANGGMTLDSNYGHDDVIYEAFDAKDDFWAALPLLEEVYPDWTGMTEAVAATVGRGVEKPDFSNILIGIRYTSEAAQREAQEGPKILPAPCFPVSDQNGFEVVGSQPYGRGLNVTLYSDLIQAAGYDSSSVLVGNGDTANNDSFRAIEEFLWRYSSNPDATLIGALRAVGDYSDVDESALGTAQQLGLTSSRELAAHALAASNVVLLTTSGTDFDPEGMADFIREFGTPERMLSNNPSNSNSYAQSLVAMNIPVSVAEISVGGANICACRGYHGSMLMSLFGSGLELPDDGGSLEFHQTDKTDMAVNAIDAEAWLRSKDAIAGRVLDLERTNIGEMISDTFGAGGTYATSFRELGQDLKEQGEALDEAAKKARDRWNEMEGAFQGNPPPAEEREETTVASEADPAPAGVATTAGENEEPEPEATGFTSTKSAVPGYDMGDE